MVKENMSLKDPISFMQGHLGYSDEEMKIFLKDPRIKTTLKQSFALLNKTFVVEVIKSHGCNSQHKPGDKFYFDGVGNLLTKLSPKKICIYALSQIERLIFGAHELFFAEQDPNDMKIKRVGCFDVGLKCGGWGRIIMEIKMIDRKDIELL
ncbi:MAG: hypothetical protein ACFFC3_12620 [Candidatus Odinarchaeota archaeon]